MKRTVARGVLSAVLVMLAGVAGAAFSQAPPYANAVLSSGTVPLGQTFELRVSVPVPPRSRVYFPDTLPATEALESHGSVRWKAEAAGDGATLTLTYRLIALGTGNVDISPPEVLLGPLDDGASGAELPGGSVIGVWNQPRGDAEPLQPLAIPSPQVRVASIFQLEGVLAGVGPLPAADVVGRNWHLPSLVLLIASAVVLIGLLVAQLRNGLRLRTTRRSEGSQPDDDARRAALNDLDALLARGLHTDGRTREFYTSSSEIVRRYIERIVTGVEPGLTSTELMRDLQARIAKDRLDALSVEMTHAEVVKFGRLLPEPAAAEAHWRAVRGWIEERWSDSCEH